MAPPSNKICTLFKFDGIYPKPGTVRRRPSPFCLLSGKQHLPDSLVFQRTEEFVKVRIRTDVQNQTRQRGGICDGIVDGLVKIRNMEISLGPTNLQMSWSEYPACLHHKQRPKAGHHVGHPRISYDSLLCKDRYNFKFVQIKSCFLL